MRVIGMIGGLGAPGPKRVVSTGLAVVHKDELVYPAVGSEAEAELALQDARSQVQVVFPVEVEVIAGGGEALVEEATALAFRRAAGRLGRIG